MRPAYPFVYMLMTAVSSSITPSACTMTTETPSPSARLRLHSPDTASAVRHSIISSSAKGWSPLQINKRDSITSPIKQSPLKAPSDSPGPRRTSSSFKHMAKNSLVANSPFKSPSTVQGQQALGLNVSPTKEVIHERRVDGRGLGQTAPMAEGVGVTPAPAAPPPRGLGMGLGITVKPRSSSRSTSASGSAVAGTRKVSSERPKAVYSGTGERRTSGERKVSGSKENDSPDIRAKKPGKSAPLKTLANAEFVSKSPFKRVPSGGLAVSPFYMNESPNPSPKTIPIRDDDVFSSPSPSVRRVSNERKDRKVSPSTSINKTARMSSSPTPSPPRKVSYNSASILAGPSPLSQAANPIKRQEETTPTPTPIKSSMTPSRRLHGPRDHLALGILDSPSKASKTVTFQPVPDVKEFERMSVEGSVDGSFEVDSSFEQEENSLDDILHDDTDLVDVSRDMRSLRVTNPDDDVEGSPLAEGYGDESTTADFVNTLIEEGLFSPPPLDTPAMPEQDDFVMPLEDDAPPVSSFAPVLSTPSLGDSVHGTPLFDGLMPDSLFPTHDPEGLPYGRSHHAERAALAHQAPHEPPHLDQPFPRNEDHQMLQNADVTLPALPVGLDTSAPVARQAGPMPDPFITLQTATAIVSPQKDRVEDGVPLGRTSHAERLQAARALATQSLGLGLPGRPARIESPNSPKTVVETLKSPPSQYTDPWASEGVKPAPKGQVTIVPERGVSLSSPAGLRLTRSRA